MKMKLIFFCIFKNEGQRCPAQLNSKYQMGISNFITKKSFDSQKGLPKQTIQHFKKRNVILHSNMEKQLLIILF